MELAIQHEQDKESFAVVIEGQRAFVTYEIYDGALDVRKTFVPKELEGRGIASKLVQAAYDYARAQNLKCIATCSYAVVWLQRHPEYAGQASSDYVEGGCAVGKHQA